MRRYSVLVALILAIAILVWQVSGIVRQGIMRPDDFAEYWAASRLLMSGGNPYDAAQLLRLQQGIGWSEPQPVMMWNPPWTLMIVMPFGLLGYPVGRLLWLAAMGGVLTACIVWLWTFYGGSPRQRWLALLLGFTFAPVLTGLHPGQISPLVLAGVVLFLYFGVRGHWLAAGCAIGALFVKPHVLYLFWLALGLWVWRARRWSVLLGAASALGVALGVALLLNPAVITQYLQAVATGRLVAWAPHTLGGLLRLLYGEATPGPFWLQFLPVLAGLAWFASRWRRRGAQWDWGIEVPFLLLVSVATSPYAWFYDQVVVLPALLQSAIWVLRLRPRLAITVGVCYLAFNLLFLFPLFVTMNKAWYVCYMLSGPLAVFGYAVLRSRLAASNSVMRPDCPKS